MFCYVLMYSLVFKKKKKWLLWRVVENENEFCELVRMFFSCWNLLNKDVYLWIKYILYIFIVF